MDYRKGGFIQQQPASMLIYNDSYVGRSRLDSDLQGSSAAHLIQRLLVILKLKDIGDLTRGLQDHSLWISDNETHHSLGLDLSALEVLDRPGEAVGLREGPDDLSGFQQHREEREPRRHTLISSLKILDGGQVTRALSS